MRLASHGSLRSAAGPSRLGAALARAGHLALVVDRSWHTRRTPRQLVTNVVIPDAGREGWQAGWAKHTCRGCRAECDRSQQQSPWPDAGRGEASKSSAMGFH